jgi:hydroxymethylbilane synthase
LKNKKIKIGTRGSKLALIQSERVKGHLKDKFPELDFELVIIRTKGDRILDSPLSKLNDKGLFTKERCWKMKPTWQSTASRTSPQIFPQASPSGLCLKEGRSGT